MAATFAGRPPAWHVSCVSFGIQTPSSSMNSNAVELSAIWPVTAAQPPSHAKDSTPPKLPPVACFAAALRASSEHSASGCGAGAALLLEGAGATLLLAGAALGELEELLDPPQAVRVRALTARTPTGSARVRTRRVREGVMTRILVTAATAVDLKLQETAGLSRWGREYRQIPATPTRIWPRG